MKFFTVNGISLVFISAMAVEVTSHRYDDEPHCYSRFDYEYKVLQRLIQLEESHKSLTDKLDEVELENTGLRNEIQSLNNTVDQLEESHKTLTDKLDEVELENTGLRNEIQSLNRTVDQLKTETGSKSQAPIVAFSAYTDKTTSMSTKTVFNRVHLNEQGAYNQSTGVFTCPVDGIYMFSVVIAVRGASTTWAGINVNGAPTLHAITEGTKSQQDLQGANLVVVKLTKGNEVWVNGAGTMPANSNGGSDKRTSSFSGFLIQPTTA